MPKQAARFLRPFVVAVALAAPSVLMAQDELVGDGLVAFIHEYPIECLGPVGAECGGIIRLHSIEDRQGAFTLDGLFMFRADEHLRVTAHGRFILGDRGLCLSDVAQAFANADMAFVSTQAYGLGDAHAELSDAYREVMLEMVLNEIAQGLEGVVTCLHFYRQDAPVVEGLLIQRNSADDDEAEPRFEEVFSMHAPGAAAAHRLRIQN